MAFDPKAIAVNWARSDEKRKRQEEERQAEYWARRPMAHPWKVEINQPPAGVVLSGDLYVIL